MPLNGVQAQQAWFVVSFAPAIASFPIVAPYIAIKTSPTEERRNEHSFSALGVICSAESYTVPLFSSPVFNQGIDPFW